jgi:nucleotide-binding universal stress UspA family protein
LFFNHGGELFFKEKYMFRKTLVCLDGSKLAEEILPFLLESCPQPASEVILLRVITAHITIPPPESTHVYTIGPDSKPDQMRTADIGKTTTLEPKAGLQLREIEREQGEAKAYLESLANAFRARGLKVRTLTLEGDAGETILNYAKNNNISLIALTTHGNGGQKRGKLGRVASLILNEAALPVLIIKPKSTAS